MSQQGYSVNVNVNGPQGGYNMPQNGYNMQQGGFRPAIQLTTKRGLVKFILFSIITFCIYPLVMMTKISNEIDVVASRYDGRKTMNFCLLTFIVAPITLGIALLVWYHRICNRMGNELLRRNLPYSISAGTFWGWMILGSLLFGIGPLVFMHKFLKAMNTINADYNIRG